MQKEKNPLRRESHVPGSPENPRAVGRPNDLPQQPHGDSLRQELTDVLYALESALGLLREERNEAGAQTVRDARNLLRSILGTPQEQTHTTDGRKLPPKRS